MYSNTYNNENFMRARAFIENSEFKKAYDFLKTLTDKCAEWYYLTGFSAMNIGYYEEGEDFLKRAKFMEPENSEYSDALRSYTQYRNDYSNRADNYNRRRRNDLDGCCCCCCDDCCCCLDDDCCENCAKLWCLDSCCECFGGDLITCC
ncbi:hypothetical protein RZ839_010755 [Clostridioides difficile]|nr:hypothetical protein [Clostridioides difficile]